MHPPSASLKLCYDCNQWLPLDRFWRNKRAKDGLCLYCRDCMTLRMAHLNEPRPHRASERVRLRLLADRKVCSECGQEKTLSRDFYPNPGNTADGYTGACRQCHTARTRRTESKERVRDYGRIWRERNREHYTRYQAAYRARHK
jgi:hypothetical protein